MYFHNFPVQFANVRFRTDLIEDGIGANWDRFMKQLMELAGYKGTSEFLFAFFFSFHVLACRKDGKL